jgi:hypothetical protein
MNAASKSTLDCGATYEEVMQAGEDAVLAHDYTTAAPLYAQAVILRGSDTILFGDSHYHMFVGVPGMTPLWMNAITAHRIGREGRAFIDPAAYGAAPTTRLGFCFGEIDVRNHIGKVAVERGLTIAQAANDLAGRYLASVLEISAGHPRPFVTTTVPQHAMSAGHVYADTVRPLEERLAASLAFNEALRRLGPQSGVDVVDIVPVLADETGLLRDDVTDDDIHVRSVEGKLAVVTATMRQLNRYQPRIIQIEADQAPNIRWVNWLNRLFRR